MARQRYSVMAAGRELSRHSSWAAACKRAEGLAQPVGAVVQDLAPPPPAAKKGETVRAYVWKFDGAAWRVTHTLTLDA